MKTPSAHEIRQFLALSPAPVREKELAAAFGLRHSDRRAYSRFQKRLRHMARQGEILKKSGSWSLSGTLPDNSAIEVTDVTIDGDVIAKPVHWNEATQGSAPHILILPDKKGHPSLSKGDRLLATLEQTDDGAYQARSIRRLDTQEPHVTGRLVKTKKGYILEPSDKKVRYTFDVDGSNLKGAKDGDFVVAENLSARRFGRNKVKIKDVIGDKADPKLISKICIHEMGLKEEFSQAVLDETANMTVPDLGQREDLRNVPLVTIDPKDARDHDDAIFAEETAEGFHLIVAIADVAHYVRPGSALDKEALERGNSTYFPDRVVPMLPEKLSNDLCSLKEGVDRACMAFHMWIDKDGKLTKYDVRRGLMRSHASLSYEQAQAAQDGQTDDVTTPLMNNVITPLYKAYDALKQAREKRGALELDRPERKITVNDKGEMTGVKKVVRLDSHMLVEEFMILTNVAVASALEDKKAPCIYRVHDKPDPAKMDNLRAFAENLGLSLSKGVITQPSQLNGLLSKIKDTPYSEMLSDIMLRTQAKAVYSPDNIGHFGLFLQRYAHSTSPIRRYADVVVHRSLIKAFNLGAGGLNQEDADRLEDIAVHISETEKKSSEAERNAVDRFAASWLSDRIGAEFTGRIRGIHSKAGLFVELDETCADGLVPMKSLPRDYYMHDEQQHALIGRRNGFVYRLGAAVTIKVKEANGTTGGSIFHLTGSSLNGADIPGMSLKKGKPRNHKGFRRR